MFSKTHHQAPSSRIRPYLFTRIRVDGRTLIRLERFQKCGFSELIHWFRVAMALQLQPITSAIHYLLSASQSISALEWRYSVLEWKVVRLIAFFLA